jgi:hypothetical protein
LLATSSRPSRYTIETLQLYLDYKKEDTHIWLYPRSNPDEVKQECANLWEKANGSTDQVLKLLVDLDISLLKFHELANQFIREAVARQDDEFIISFYQLKSTYIDHPNIFYYLGLALQNNQVFASTFIPSFARSHRARKYFFERFVNTGAFKTYRSWLEAYRQEESDPVKLIWVDSLIGWGDHLSKRTVRFNELFFRVEQHQQELKVAHPLIRARVYGLGLVSEEWFTHCKDVILKELEQELNDLKKQPDYTPFFSTLILQYLLYYNSPPLLRKLEQVLQHYYPPLRLNTDYSMPFLLKVIQNRLYGEEDISLDEVLHFNYGFSNENYLVQWVALGMVKDEESDKALSLRKTILDRSGFLRLQES